MSFWRSVMACVLAAIGLANAQAGTLVQFRTFFGTAEVELYDQQKPATVNNFKKLVQAGAYKNTFFHRVLPGFVAQGGGFTIPSPTATVMGPPWSQLFVVPNFGTITNEFNVGPFLSNTNGTIAMAKADGNPNSATSQWFFNLANNSTNLDNQNGGFTVFGHVVGDPNNLLPTFNQLSPGHGIINMQWYYGTNDPVASLLHDLGVTFDGTSPPPNYNELLFVDITMLSVQIASTNNQRQISWNSINGRTNLVEFTTNFPPVWRTLITTNGNGGRAAVTDSSATNAFRFYRVRVLY
jgi:cyclophilin family peptidyl-prolyl cis-trans isomerase